MLTLEKHSSSYLNGFVSNGISSDGKKHMYETFQTWALKTYGDSGKTKTVTRRKYDRIVRILTGEEEATTENSKFRFWVKAKGFKLGPGAADARTRNVLFVPVKQTCESAGRGNGVKEYKRVAIVDDFFDIIYGVHVEMDGRGGKHAGQKRTYRAIAETYSFLPREAVTRFLMSCADCQKRMHIGTDTPSRNSSNHQNHAHNGQEVPIPAPNGLSSQNGHSSHTGHSRQNGHSSRIGHSDQNGHAGHNNNNEEKMVVGLHGRQGHANYPPIIDFSVPITQTYLNHMRNNIYLPSRDYMDDEESVSSVNSEMSTETDSSPKQEANGAGSEPKAGGARPVNNGSPSPKPKLEVSKVEHGEVYSPLNIVGTHSSLSPLPRDESKGHPERKRRASDDDSCETSSKASEATNDDPTKDDDDDNDDDDDDKVPLGSNIDPERLKSFNMFCRLFVDENLDRTVPISKQPKDKVQAILDACDRQFPEFHERARKRIRTYLKSCRRMRRSKENGWEPLRPTPPHLTSAAAESYLAQACENESINAKRMRMGLEPLPASAMPITHHPPLFGATATPQKSALSPSLSSPSPPKSEKIMDRSSDRSSERSDTKECSAGSSSGSRESRESRESGQAARSSSTPTPSHVDRHTPVSTVSSTDFIRHPPAPTAFRPPPDFPPFFTNGNGLFRPGFPGYQHPAHHHPSVLHSPIQPSSLQNGPTDLSMKKQSSKSQLSTSEVSTIKQLISGYRESAAFLYRSADELEQLLLQQN